MNTAQQHLLKQGLRDKYLDILINKDHYMNDSIRVKMYKDIDAHVDFILNGIKSQQDSTKDYKDIIV